MQMADKIEGWGEWSQHVLHELKRLNKAYEALDERLREQDRQITINKVKIGIWGVVGGSVASTVVALIKG